MTIDALIGELRAQGVRLRSDHERLRVEAAPGVLTDALRQRIAAHKPELLRLLAEGGTAQTVIPRVDRACAQPLSFAQQRLWFLDQVIDDKSVYNVPLALEIDGELQAAHLCRALDGLVAGHEALRTSYADGLQRVQPPYAVALPTHDLVGTDDAKAALDTLVAAALRMPFDLAEGRPLRACLVRMGENRHVLVLVLHHIACDAWSLNLLLEALVAAYDALLSGRPCATAEPSAIDYLDYAAFQRDTAGASGAADTILRQYASRVGKSITGTVVASDRPRPPVQRTEGASVRASLSPELVAGLRRLAQQEDASLFMAVLAAAKLLLFRTTRGEDVVVGVPSVSRDRAELQSVVGCFLNTVVMRTATDGSQTGRALLRAVRETARDSAGYGAVPFERLVEALHVERDPSFTPLFQVMVFLQSEPVRTVQAGGLRWHKRKTENGRAKFDLTFEVEERSDGGAELILHYATALFGAEAMARMAEHFVRLASELAQYPDRPIGTLAMLGEQEHARLRAWNASTLRPAPAPTVHGWFELQVDRTPEADALCVDGVTLTYAALNAQANRLAYRLIELDIGAGSRVGVYCGRQQAMLVGMLAILKAGAAYVPLDPSYPRERVALMAEDAALAAILTQPALATGLPPTSAAVLEIEATPGVHAGNVANPPARAGATDLSHLIYTSGSTGRPKGIMIEHRNVNALLGWAHDVFTAAELSGVLAATSICFDLSVFELFAPLTCGGCVHLVENALHLPQCASRDRVTMVNTVPSAMAELLRNGTLPATVTTVNLAGEPLVAELVAQVLQQKQVEAVYNLYGPSEDTTYSTFARLDRTTREAPTIGRPLFGKQVHILDADLQPVPLGSPGEIYMGGAGVARGYFNRPDLDAGRFIADPFAEGRLYRTGDLGRFLPDGRIVYLGRADFQVKVHGFRIELGEIEAVLRTQEGVRECVAVVRQDGIGGSTIVAYVGGVVDPAASRARLRTVLPAFMVPSAVVVLDALPQTPNGKVDRNRLPAPARIVAEPMAGLPRSGLAHEIAQIWKDLLRIEAVGLDDNFFETGGHSLLVLQMHARLKQLVGRDFPIIELFRSPTIRTLSAFLDANGDDAASFGDIVSRAKKQRAMQGRRRGPSAPAAATTPNTAPITLQARI